MSTLFSDSPVSLALTAILAALDAGLTVDDSVERQKVDLKEEHGRRDRAGTVLPGQRTNEVAAKDLSAAAACMANTPGGGALIVGVSNAGDLIGTNLDEEALRHRIWELTNRALTVDIAVRTCRGCRLLLIVVPQAIEPIRVDGRIRWRVGANCVEVDPTTWHAKRMAVLNYDWSSEESTLSADEARPAAIAQARAFLIQSQEPHATELAQQSDIHLLRRLGVVSPEGRLTNAGVIAFVGREKPCIDYIRREHTGGDSLHRVRLSERSLLEELQEAFTALEFSVPLIHFQHGLVVGQHHELPLRAAREAIVNGVVHREWAIQEPTVIEHVGRTLRVTSHGGFVGGVTSANIITHPSRSRNRALVELLAALRVAEREGIGVDRMVGDLVRQGNPAPSIAEINGPCVRASLVGDSVDSAWIVWLTEITPHSADGDLNTLLILRRLVDDWWIDVTAAAVLIQDSPATALHSLARVAELRIDGQPLIQTLSGVPESHDPVWTLSARARRRMAAADASVRRERRSPSRAALARGYVHARRRISSTELGGLLGVSPTNVGGVLKGLEEEGVLEPAWPSRRGKGFHYRLAGTGIQSPERAMTPQGAVEQVSPSLRDPL